MQPTVTLINPPTHVLETIWILWEASKVDGPVATSVEEVAATIPKDKLEKLFWDVLRQHIPVAEHINFIFMLDGVSVSLREQMVRHRIGTHIGDRVGVDIVPDLADSTWWSQSMRIQDMGAFAERQMYRIPETLEGKTVTLQRGIAGVQRNAKQLYMETMNGIEAVYRELVAAGIPMEDARELIPLGAQHRISWGLNLQALLHILGKRGCWILQLGIWGPIIHGMVNELAAKVHPMFARIVAPPCIDHDDNFTSCKYRLENARRMPDGNGDVHDHHAPCPLWLCRDGTGQQAMLTEIGDTDDIVARELNSMGKDFHEVLINSEDLVPRHREMKARAEEYRKLWHHDPYTWAKL